MLAEGSGPLPLFFVFVVCSCDKGFLENLHILSCFVQLKSVHLFYHLCVFDLF